MRRLCLTLAIFILVLMVALAPSGGIQPAALAAEGSGEALAASLPTSITELVSGGSWRHAGTEGTYRVLLLQEGTPATPRAAVYAQWLGERADTGGLEHIVTVPITEFNSLGRPEASISLDGDTTNAAQLEITSPELAGRELRVALRLHEPGVYEILPPAAAATFNPPGGPKPSR